MKNKPKHVAAVPKTKYTVVWKRGDSLSKPRQQYKYACTKCTWASDETEYHDCKGRK